MSERSHLPIALGFLTVVQEPSGWVGGYLVTNSWGRPLEFRLTTAVQPNRVQSVLYGPTLTEYLHVDVIGKTLIEKTSVKPDLIVADNPAALGLRSRLEIPTVVVYSEGETISEAVPLTHARTTVPLLVPRRYESDCSTITDMLDRVDAAVDLAEPFTRIREAVIEARKTGVTSRVA